MSCNVLHSLFDFYYDIFSVHSCKRWSRKPTPGPTTASIGRLTRPVSPSSRPHANTSAAVTPCESSWRERDPANRNPKIWHSRKWNDPTCCMIMWKKTWRRTDCSRSYGCCAVWLRCECVCVSWSCRILSCLMEHLYTEKMVEDCEHRLLELQYFIARDWK